MADQQFEILMKFGLDKSKAEEAVRELEKLGTTQKKVNEQAVTGAKEVEEQSKKTGQEGVKQQEQVTQATDEAFASQKQYKDALRQLQNEFPILGRVATLALNPVALSAAAVVAAISVLRDKTREYIKDLGGFNTVDFGEGLEKRFERISEVTGAALNNLNGIKATLSAFEQEQKILGAWDKGLGKDPDPAVQAQAAREAGERALIEARRQAAIAGNFNPNNPAADDIAKRLPDLIAERDRLRGRMNYALETQDAGFFDPQNLGYLFKFGAVPPRTKARELQGSLSSVQSQIDAIMGAGADRARRGDAFAASQQGFQDASGYFTKAAELTGQGVEGAAKQFKAAGEAIDPLDVVGTLNNIVRMAEAFSRGKQQTDEALRLMDDANRISSQLNGQ